MRALWLVAMFFTAVLAQGFGPPAVAQQDDAVRLGSDVFRAGNLVIEDAADIDNAFLAGQRVRLATGITGSAHLAGRIVEAAGPVSRDLYAAGYAVGVSAPIAGDATLAGYEITVDAEVGGSLRATGRSVAVSAPVGGPSILAGNAVRLDAPIDGDVALYADRVLFGEAAAITGRLIIYGDEDAPTAVPEHVVPPERIELRASEAWDRGTDLRAPSIAAAAGGFIVGALILALLAWLAAVIAPVGIEVLRDRVSLKPFRTLGLGFLALSALIGAAVVLALTVIGLIVVPVILLMAAVLGIVGWIVSVYMLGASLWEGTGRGEPDTLGERAIAALIGALVASVVLLVPFLGWLFMLVAMLVGMGALTSNMVRGRG